MRPPSRRAFSLRPPTVIRTEESRNEARRSRIVKRRRLRHVSAVRGLVLGARASAAGTGAAAGVVLVVGVVVAVVAVVVVGVVGVGAGAGGADPRRNIDSVASVALATRSLPFAL